MSDMELRLPKFEETSDETIIVAWLKKVGDSVAKDEPLLEVETEKFTHPILAPADATVVSIEAQEGDELEVGALLAVLRPLGG